MNNATYLFNPLNDLLSHSHQPPAYLGDSATDQRKDLLNAQVRSGDYLATLATQLNELAHSLSVRNEGDSAVLEFIVQDLLYLQQTYDLIRKK